MNAITIACITASIAITTSHALPEQTSLPPSLPAYATQQWIHYAASIVAGETVPGCEICDRWIACTIQRDIERGYYPWALHPGRWHGYRTPRPEHLAAVEAALHPQGCLDVPTCAYLGNLNDYRYWSAGRLAQDVSCHLVGNRHGAIVCIPPTSPATPPPARCTATPTRPGPRPPASPALVRPHQANHADE